MTQLTEQVPTCADAVAESPLARFVRRQAGGLPRAFWALWTGTLVNRIGYLVEPFLAYYLTGHRGLSVTSAGIVLAANGLGGIFSQVIAGAGTDVIGRRATLTLGMLANGASLIALGYARGMLAIFAITFLFGVTVDMYQPASDALVADLVPSPERPRAYGLLYWAINLGFSMAMVLGGTLARAGFQWLFWADAVTCVLFGLIVWRLVPDTRPTQRQAKGRAQGRGTRDGFRVVLRDGVMVGFMTLSLAYTFVYLQAYTTLPLAMKLQGLSPGDFGLALTLNGVLIVVIQPMVNAWLARRDNVRVLAAGIAVVGLGYGLTSLADSWAMGYLLAPLGGTHLLVLGAPVLWLTCSGLCATASIGLLALGPAIRGRSAPSSVTVPARHT
jgi:predicted MFS family arabinose efflux permease